MTEQCCGTDGSDVSVEDIQCYCRLDGLLEVLTRKYAIQVLCLVWALQPARYAEIEAALEDVSSSTLSTRLEELTEAGLLHRERYAEIPPRVEYRITDDGAELCALLDPLVRWAAERGAPDP
ncbi:winged helix-turn-helix transcriptional regulator [Natronobeatus ordinarius]|uniref:winged helix-turn-helix transcriptional regulator n=1 Tax=Natronobeatus ordinarius TaxID=2963433 RepID=UPI0020CB6B7B|nr:helix-turn-helix domain-containing protein [Natronobeatus ordinarius]